MSCEDKRRFVGRLRSELESIRRDRKGRATGEDVARIAGQLREFVSSRKKEAGQMDNGRYSFF